MKQRFLNTFLFISLLAVTTLFSSCGGGDLFPDTSKHCEVSILVQKVGNKGKSYPSDITNLLMPLTVKECGDSVLTSTLKLLRIDLSNQVEQLVEVPRSTGENFLGANDDAEKIAEKMKTVTIPNSFTEEAKTIDETKLNALIKKFGGAKNVFGFSENGGSITVGGEPVKFYTDFKQLKAEMLNRSCSVQDGKFLILYNLNLLGTTPPVPNDNDKPQAFVSSDPLVKDLQIALSSLIDTKKGSNERIKLAKSVEKQYFAPNGFYAKTFDSPSSTNPSDVWDMPDGHMFLEHLAITPSILSVQVFKVEKDKETNKISGIHIIEQHN
jgi:hypothetical protein